MLSCIMRRLSNLHWKIGIGEKLKVVDKFTQQMRYTRQQCRQAVVSGLLEFKRKGARKTKSGESMYWYKDRRKSVNEDEDDISVKDKLRKSKEGRVSADKKGGMIKKSAVKSIMFVPYTHGSKLAKRLREAEVKLEGQTGLV